MLKKILCFITIFLCALTNVFAVGRYATNPNDVLQTLPNKPPQVSASDSQGFDGSDDSSYSKPVQTSVKKHKHKKPVKKHHTRKHHKHSKKKKRTTIN